MFANNNRRSVYLYFSKIAPEIAIELLCDDFLCDELLCDEQHFSSTLSP
jgi:hypothetical protein